MSGGVAGGATSVVLIAAGGAGWEPEALTVLDRARGVVVLRRCVDLDDLLAAAASGQADVALVALELPGLDAPSVDQLRQHGLRTVAVVPAVPAAEALRSRAAHLGVRRLLSADDLSELPEALARIEVEVPAPRAPRPTPREERHGRVVAVWGPAGAPGRTTVAAGVAAELARRRLSTVLVDADPYGGAVAPLLGILDDVSGLLAAGRLAAAGQLAERLSTVVRVYAPHLGVVTGLPRADRWAELRPGLVAELADVGRSQGHVVIDTGFSLEDGGDPAGPVPGRAGRDQPTLEALAEADDVLVVGTAGPVGLARLARGLADLREHTPRPPYVVVNRMRPSLGWSEREIVAMLSGVVTTAGIRFLPDDSATVDRAAVAGRSLIEEAPDAALTRALAALVDEIAPAVAGRRADRSRRRVPRWRRMRPDRPGTSDP